MSKTPKKLVFELGGRQILFALVCVVIVGFMVFRIGVVVGSKSARQEMAAARLKEDPRMKIKAPSLLNSTEKAPVSSKGPESIEAVLDMTKKEDPATPVQETVQPPEKTEIKKVKEDVKVAAEKKTDPRPVKMEAPKVPEERYFVQVASFPSAADAKKRKAELEAKGYSVVVVTADIPGKGIYHRVRLGPFSSLDKAKNFALKFEKKEKVSTFIPID